jgi:hypothetical protein
MPRHRLGLFDKERTRSGAEAPRTRRWRRCTSRVGVWIRLRLGHLHSAAEYAVPLPPLGLHRRLKDGPEIRRDALRRPGRTSAGSPLRKATMRPGPRGPRAAGGGAAAPPAHARAIHKCSRTRIPGFDGGRTLRCSAPLYLHNSLRPPLRSLSGTVSRVRRSAAAGRIDAPPRPRPPQRAACRWRGACRRRGGRLLLVRRRVRADDV